MKNALVYILENIIEGKFEVTEEESDGFITFKISAPQEEIGKIIGKGGKTINSIKNLLKIRAIKEGKKIDIQVSEAE